jgi:hypothetical protein
MFNHAFWTVPLIGHYLFNNAERCACLGFYWFPGQECAKKLICACVTWAPKILRLRDQDNKLDQ